MATSRRSVMRPTEISASRLGTRATTKTKSTARKAPQRNGDGPHRQRRIRSR